MFLKNYLLKYRQNDIIILGDLSMKQENIRNFSIIAHIDHGKSTLADRILEKTNAIDKRQMKDQLLDSMDLERERGITIKLNTVKLNYEYENEVYELNLIDTPGHVDFSYEVSRSLASCEGAVLLVDATQGIEAQTLANLYLALENNLTIIPVINKIDLPNADVLKVMKELEDVLGFKEEEIITTSGKTGEGVDNLLQAIIKRVKPPIGNKNNPLKALIFDSYFDQYLGVVALVRVFDGTLKVKDKIKLMQTGSEFEVVTLGVHTPNVKELDELSVGEVGFISASIKDLSKIKVGATITTCKNSAIEALPGYQEMKPMVY